MNALLTRPVPGISASPKQDNLRYFTVVIAGPPDTPYDGVLLSQFSLNIIRWCFSLGAFPAWILSNGPTQSALLDQDLSPQR